MFMIEGIALFGNSNQSKFLPLFWIPSNNYVSNLNTVHQKDEMILMLRYIVKALQIKFPSIQFAMKIPHFLLLLGLLCHLA